MRGSTLQGAVVVAAGTTDDSVVVGADVALSGVADSLPSGVSEGIVAISGVEDGAVLEVSTELVTVTRAGVCFWPAGLLQPHNPNASSPVPATITARTLFRSLSSSMRLRFFTGLLWCSTHLGK
jgi:hypothetical protein